MTAYLTTEELLKQLMNNHTKAFVEQLAARLKAENFDLNKIIDLTFHTDAKVGFRAAWLLDNMMLTSPEHYSTYLPYFVKCMGDVTNASCKRHYARIIMHLTLPSAPQAIRQKIQEIDMEPVVERCFDWLIDLNVKVAVKVCAADTLFNLTGRYDWI